MITCGLAALWLSLLSAANVVPRSRRSGSSSVHSLIHVRLAVGISVATSGVAIVVGTSIRGQSLFDAPQVTMPRGLEVIASAIRVLNITYTVGWFVIVFVPLFSLLYEDLRSTYGWIRHGAEGRLHLAQAASPRHWTCPTATKLAAAVLHRLPGTGAWRWALSGAKLKSVNNELRTASFLVIAVSLAGAVTTVVFSVKVVPQVSNAPARYTTLALSPSHYNLPVSALQLLLSSRALLPYHPYSSAACIFTRHAELTICFSLQWTRAIDDFIFYVWSETPAPQSRGAPQVPSAGVALTPTGASLAYTSTNDLPRFLIIPILRAIRELQCLRIGVPLGGWLSFLLVCRGQADLHVTFRLLTERIRREGSGCIAFYVSRYVRVNLTLSGPVADPALLPLPREYAHGWQDGALPYFVALRGLGCFWLNWDHSHRALFSAFTSV